jgi:hypothetical protein
MTVYYVDAAKGSDAADGKAAARSWRTLAKVNAAPLNPGDTVTLRGVFLESLRLKRKGTSATHIKIRGDEETLIMPGPSGHGIVVEPTAAYTTVRDIRISDCAIGVNGIYKTGLLPSHSQARNINFERLAISRTADSAIIDLGYATRITNCLIDDAGNQPSSPEYGVHGIYAKGALATYTGNVIRNSRDSGLSLRMQGQTATNNLIVGAIEGISWYSYALGDEPIIVSGNMVRESRVGIYISRELHHDQSPPSISLRENWVHGPGGGVGLSSEIPLVLNSTIYTGVFRTREALA